MNERLLHSRYINRITPRGSVTGAAGEARFNETAFDAGSMTGSSSGAPSANVAKTFQVRVWRDLVRGASQVARGRNDRVGDLPETWHQLPACPGVGNLAIHEPGPDDGLPLREWALLDAFSGTELQHGNGSAEVLDSRAEDAETHRPTGTLCDFCGPGATSL